MTQQINGCLGDWAAQYAKAKPIAVEIKTACLALFKQGTGYRKAARTLGLKLYTVRDWLRRFKAGDEAWAKRDGSKFCRRFEAKDVIQYRHEIKTFIPGLGSIPTSDGSRICSDESLAGRESQMAGSAKHAVAIPLYSADGACERILAGGCHKKKEIIAVQTLHDNGYTIEDACRIAGTPYSSYYRNLKSSAKAESDAALVRLMCEIENDKHILSAYGVGRLTAEINRRLAKDTTGLAEKILRGRKKVNHKRVHRLMKQHDIHSRIRRKTHPDSYYKAVKEALKKNFAPNILERNFTAEKPLTKLVTDVTYIPCSDGKFIYLSPLFDLFNNEIISYSISTINSAEFIKRMLTELPPDILKGAMIHNDQGSVYWSYDWVELCEKFQIVRSMSRRGNCWDNAMMENFFSSLKAELGLTKREYKTFLTAQEITDLIADYIQWYNTDRLQKKLNFMSPIQFKEAYLNKTMQA